MNDPSNRLDSVVQAQQGFFTAKQAIAAGYSARSHTYHTGTGAWVREYRGIYRFARYPSSTDAHYVLWSLWSCNRRGEPQGVYSHQTALSIHELSDAMPSSLHMTVPPTFRRMADPPRVLVLHFGALPPDAIEQRQGYRVVRPLQAIAGLLQEGNEPPARLRQALKQALARGVATRADMKAHPNARGLQALLRRGDG